MTTIQPAPPYTLLPLPSRINGKDEPDSDVISLGSSLGSEKTTIADLQDFHVDASTLLGALQNLLSIQDFVVEGLIQLRTASEKNGSLEIDGVLDTTAQAAHDLSFRSQKLRRAVQDNAKDGKVSVPLKRTHTSKEEEDYKLDMGASIYKWSNDCVIAMLSLQEDVHQLLKQDIRDDAPIQKTGKSEAHEEDFDELESISDLESWAEDITVEDAEEGEMVVTLHRHVEPLVSLTERLDDLLGIMQDIAGNRKNFTPAANVDQSSSGYSYRTTRKSEPVALYPKAQPDTPYTLLRRELYALKDQLKDQQRFKWYTRTDSAQKGGYPPSGEPWKRQHVSNQQIECYENLSYAYIIVSELLSNNGEDWLASEKDGRMSFGTFQNLDREWVYQLRVKLELDGKIRAELEEQALPRRAENIEEGYDQATSWKGAQDVDRLVGILAEVLVMLGDRRVPIATKAVDDDDEFVAGSDRMAERMVVLGDW